MGASRLDRLPPFSYIPIHLSAGSRPDAMPILIDLDPSKPIGCTAVIAVSGRALAEAGHIRALTEGRSGQSKYEFHALAQMALIQFEEGQLKPLAVAGTIRVTAGDERMELKEGLLIGRLETGQIVLLLNAGGSARKFLEAAHRFCARWVRLDL
jgi:hypothetical protein